MLAVNFLAALLAAAPPSDPAAARIGLKVHADAALIQKLPRFDYQARTRWGEVKSMRAEANAGLAELTRALEAEISQEPRHGMGWYEFGFSWDETRFLSDSRPGETVLPFGSIFGTRSDGWDRGEAKDRSSRNFVRRAGVGRFWKDDGGAGGILVESSYLKLTHQKWWWGESHSNSGQAVTHQPIAGASWAALPAETFAGEACDVVEVSGKYGRFQRLWVSRASGRVRGVLTFYDQGKDYGALVRFGDHREVAPGVWLPFAEDWAVGGRDGAKYSFRRSEVRVVSARTGIDLTDRVAALMPGAGDSVQDQRFAAPVNTRYDPARPDADIEKEADALHARMVSDAELIKKLTEPIAQMLGKPAPKLPADDWVGGARPDVAGTPYLIHFWSVSCGPCKNDLPLLNKLAADGVRVVGAHPPGTPPGDVAKVVAARKLGYPTVVSDGGVRDGVAGYPVPFNPYCVFVNAGGKVAAHGRLDDVVRAAGGALKPAKP